MTSAALVLALLIAPIGTTAAEPVLLDFHAEWCGPCQKMRPEVDALVQKHYPVRSIDIDADHAPRRARNWLIAGKRPQFEVFHHTPASRSRIDRGQALRERDCRAGSP